MTEQQKKYYENMPNLQLVEQLIYKQELVSNIYSQREQCEFGSEEWNHYHEMYHDEEMLLIDIKYMVIARMVGGCSGTGK